MKDYGRLQGFQKEFIDFISVWYQKLVYFWHARTRWISRRWCINTFSRLRGGLYWQEQQVNLCFTDIFRDFNHVEIKYIFFSYNFCKKKKKNNATNCLICYFLSNSEKSNTVWIGMSPVYFIFHNTSPHLLWPSFEYCKFVIGPSLWIWTILPTLWLK